ncbi:MAG: N-acyl amino acid synthase FeeM domain-containing protein [bacterium]
MDSYKNAAPVYSDCYSLEKREQIFIRQVENQEDLIKALNIRWRGYVKYFMNKEDLVDQYDFAPNVTLFLAEDEHHKAVGTLRILDREYGNIELDEYIDVERILPNNVSRCAEVTRFSIPAHPQAKLIKLMLWKAFLLYCMRNRINNILISGRPVVRRAYKSLLFDEVGTHGTYYHPRLGNLEHRCFICNIIKKKHLLSATNPSLYDFFFVKYHATIDKNCYRTFVPKNLIFRIRLPYKNTNQMLCSETM